MGTIRAVVRRCVVMGYDAQGTYLQFNSQTEIHEKTQKGILDTKTESPPLAKFLMRQTTSSGGIQERTVRERHLYGQRNSMGRVHFHL